MGNDESIETKLAVLANDMNYVRQTLDKVDHKVSTNYVTKEEFEPIKRFVYGLIAAFTVALVSAVVTLLVTLR